MAKDISEYSISNPPPADHPGLAKWVYGLFEESYAEKERLGWMDRAVSNYKLFRGNHWGDKKRGSNDKVTVNLNFANIIRTVANITAKNPVAEVIDLDYSKDGADQVLSLKLKKYWNETEQQALLARSVLNNEIYGATIEKAVWDSTKKQFMPIVIDGYSYFPAPGYYPNIQDMPYQIHAYSMPVKAIEKIYNVKGIIAEDVQNILGREDREDVRPNQILVNKDSGTVKEQVSGSKLMSGEAVNQDGLVIELWIKDFSRNKNGDLTYPDGIRVISVCNQNVFLNDMANPNINLELDEELIRTSFAWGRYPFYMVNSYEDTTSIWGFAAAEQTGELNKKINEIVSRMTSYCNRVLYPTLVVEKGAGITKSMINNKPGLVLMPTRPNARIEFLQVPNLPSNFFNILDTLVTFHDRVYQIEDADRGVQPTGVTAASAIVSLQERNAVLIRHKIRAAEYLCRERGRWHISFLQNFSVKAESIPYKDEVVEFTGTDLAGRKFNYVIESDSTVARTSVQDQEQAVGLFKINAIDRTALLQQLNFPEWKQIIERMGETQLDEAFQVLIDAGLEEDMAAQLKQFLMQPQTEEVGAQPEQPQPGTPKAQQGGM